MLLSNSAIHLQAAAAREAFQILCKEADIVVADEGHQIKNPKTARFIAMCSFETMRRVALTGYPLQNNMDEYYTMIQWCQKDILDSADYFHETWAKPIAEGRPQCAMVAALCLATLEPVEDLPLPWFDWAMSAPTYRCVGVAVHSVLSNCLSAPAAK